MAWKAVQIKTLYNSNAQYKKLKELLIKSYGFKEEDLFFPGNFERKNPYDNYVFMNYNGDFLSIWGQLCKEKYISGYDGFLEVSDDEMQAAFGVNETSKEIPENLKLYDIVTISYGPYAKMFGLIMKIREKDVEVGFNLFTGPQFKKVEKDLIIRLKSLFEIWKFPVRKKEENHAER